MRVVVINLDRSPERLGTFGAQAARIGLVFERLAAVDAATILEPRGRMTPGEIACFESHCRAWQSLVESGDDWLAVFEDDVVLSSALTGFLAAPERLPVDAHLIKLEAFEEEVSLARRRLDFGGFALHRMLSSHWGSAGYLISRRAAAQFLERTAGFQRPIDVTIFDPSGEAARGLGILQAVPALCIQEHFLARKALRPPLHDGLIKHSESRTVPRLSRLTPLGRLQREIGRVARRLGRLVARSLRPFTRSRRLVVPFLEP